MTSNFLVVLFKNKIRRKIIRKFVGKDNCYSFFNRYISNQNIYFPLEFENGKECKYEISIIEKNGNIPTTINRDEFGRNVNHKIDGTDYVISKLMTYKFEESVFEVSTKTKKTLLEIVTIFSKIKELKLVFKLNNKVIFQSDDTFEIYSCKTEEESTRFLNELQRYCIENKKGDYLISHSEDVAHKKQLYKQLVDRGFDIKMLYRKATTHPKGR